MIDLDRVLVTSPPDRKYNGLAYVLGDDQRWWWPDPMEVHFWPDNLPRHEGIEAFRSLLAGYGYLPCDHGELEAGNTKIAVHTQAGDIRHFSRQLPDGRWASKLGAWVDVEHQLAELEAHYGKATWFFARSH